MVDSYVEVARFFASESKQKGEEIGLLKLMKLVYIAHGFFLARLGRSFLGRDEFQAWPYGPVLPELYRAYKADKSQFLAADNIPDGAEKRLLDAVSYIYGSVEAYDLVALTHSIDSPWYKSYERGYNVIISDESIKQHYEKLINKHYRDLVEERVPV